MRTTLGEVLDGETCILFERMVLFNRSLAPGTVMTKICAEPDNMCFCRTADQISVRLPYEVEVCIAESDCAISELPLDLFLNGKIISAGNIPAGAMAILAETRYHNNSVLEPKLNEGTWLVCTHQGPEWTTFIRVGTGYTGESTFLIDNRAAVIRVYFGHERERNGILA